MGESWSCRREAQKEAIQYSAAATAAAAVIMAVRVVMRGALVCIKVHLCMHAM